MSKEEKDICPWCNHDRGRFHPYVYAHWSIRLNTKCEKCGKPYYVRNGILTKITRKAK